MVLEEGWYFTQEVIALCMKMTEEKGKLPELNLPLFPFTEDFISKKNVLTSGVGRRRVWERANRPQYFAAYL